MSTICKKMVREETVTVCDTCHEEIIDTFDHHIVYKLDGQVMEHTLDMCSVCRRKLALIVGSGDMGKLFEMYAKVPTVFSSLIGRLVATLADEPEGS